MNKCIFAEMMTDTGEGVTPVRKVDAPNCYNCKYSNGRECSFYKKHKFEVEEDLYNCSKYLPNFDDNKEEK